MNSAQRSDVLIVGAGPVGLTLANDLAARGVNFRIIDLLPEPTRNSRAHGLQARTLEALDALNLTQPILAAAQHPQPPFLILSGNKTVARIDFASYLHQPYPYQLVIWQQRVERVLLGELERRGRRVERSTRLLAFETDEGGVTADVDCDNGNRDVIRAAWIVGCDGGHSTVREALGLKMQGKTMPGCFWLGEFDIAWKRSQDTAYEWWHRDGMVGAVYIDFTHKWHVFIECHDGCNERPDLARMQAVFRERTREKDAQLSNPAWINTLTINQRMPDHFIAGRAILAGDAAHVHSGAGGQGMNTGIQDALNLGWKLAITVSGAASPTLLQTYESERLPNARDVLRASETFHHIEIPRGVIGRWIGATMFRAVQSIRPFGEAALGRVGMLGINYQHSTLSRQESRQATRHTRAGFRIPDAPCRIGGRTDRVFSILRGTQANLLLFAGVGPVRETVTAFRTLEREVAPLEAYLRVHYLFSSEADADDAGVSGANLITDGGQHLQTALGLREPEVLYVRPDGYIGLRTQDLGGGGLRGYLRLIYTGTDTRG